MKKYLIKLEYFYSQGDYISGGTERNHIYTAECKNDKEALKYAEEKFNVYDWLCENIEGWVILNHYHDYDDIPNTSYCMGVYRIINDDPTNLKEVGEVQEVWTRDVAIKQGIFSDE